MKKFLSLVLALVMTMSLVTIGAGAKEFTDDEKITYDEAVNVISTIGVVDGYEDGSFNPQGALTRGAAAKIICNMILGPTTAAELRADTAPFKDVPTNHTFAGYIAYCAKEGIISGYADGSFRPSGTLTGYAFMKMLLGALGYDANREGYVGANWSINVAKQALAIGLNASLQDDFNGVKAVNREEACLYAFNTLKADLVEYETIVSTTINGQNVNIGNSIAKAQTWQNSATRKKNIKDDNYIQFAEQYFTKLVLTEDVDVFGRPDREWEFEGKDIGTYVNYDLLVGEYTEKVTGLDLYSLLGKSTIEDYTTTVYIDGITSKSIDENIFTAADMNKNNKEKVGATGDGVLTQVFQDTDDKEITVAIINTYLAIASADYNTKKETVSFDVYGVTEKSVSGGKEYVKDDDDVKLTASIDDFDVEGVKEDDAYLVNIADGEIQIMQKAEVLEDTEISSFKIGSNVTADGTKYSYADTANYDPEVLDSYTGTGNGTVNLKDLSYNIYLDQYGFLIGVDLVEEADNYVFITGIDKSYSNLSTKNVDAAGIFIDGTMETIKVKTSKSTGLPTSDLATVNKWYTYTVDSDGVYTLKLVGDVNASITNVPGGSDNSTKLAQYADKTWGNTTVTELIDKKNIYLPGANGVGEYAKVYGNDKTVYLTASIKEIVTDSKRTDIIIDDVDSVTTGVKNANIEVWGSRSAELADAEAKIATSSTTQSAGVYTLYKNNGYIIATVVVGEDAAASKNLVYAHTSKVEIESYEKSDDQWTWLRKVTYQGEEVTIKEVGDALTYLDQMDQYNWYQVKFNGNDEVISVELASVALTGNKYVNDISVLDAAVNDEDTVLYESPNFLSDKPVMRSGVLYVTQTIAANNGFHVAEDVKFALIQTNKNKEETEWDAGVDNLQDVIDNLNETDKVYDYQISAIIEDGDATVVVIYDRTNTYTPGTVTGSGYSIDYAISNNGRVTMTVTYNREAWMADDADVTLEFDVYANGYWIDSARGSSAVVIPAGQNTGKAMFYATAAEPGDEITINITKATPDAVNIKYVDENGKSITSKLVKGYTKTLSTQTAGNIAFYVDTNDTSKTLEYKITGLLSGDTTTWTTCSNNNNEVKSWNGVKAEGDDYVTISLKGLDDLATVYTTTSDVSSTQLKTWGVTDATDKALGLTVAVTSGATTRVNGEVKGTAKLSGSPSATGIFGYRVVCSEINLDAVLTSGTAADWSFRAKGNVEIDASDIYVTPIENLKVASYTWNAGEITIVFSENVDKTTVNSTSVKYTSTDSSATAKDPVVNGTVVTIKAASGDFKTGDTVKVGTGVKETENGATVASEVTITLGTALA